MVSRARSMLPASHLGCNPGGFNPGRQLPAVSEPLTEFSTGNGKHACLARGLILRHIGVALRNIHQPGKRHDLYPEFLTVPTKQILGGIGLVERMPIGIMALPGMIPDN